MMKSIITLLAVMLLGTAIRNCGTIVTATADEPPTAAAARHRETPSTAETELLTAEGQWGGISGQIVLDGPVPERKVIQAAGGAIIRNPAVCGAVGLHDDSLLVDPDSRGIANCFVYLSKAPKDIHPQLKALAMKNLVFDQKRCVFVPRSLFVQVGQTVEITSGDPIPHNVHIHPLRNQPINVLLPPAGHAAQAIMWTPTERESIPFRVSNDIHPWMTAHWLVLDHPYAAMTDTNGHFRIVGLSAGLYEFRIWHERADIIERKYQVVVPVGAVRARRPLRVPIETFHL